MILYQVISSYQLLCAITHKSTAHKDDECVLIISTWLVDKFPHYKDLNKFFKKVIVMDAQMRISDKYHEENKDYCEKLLLDNGFSIGDFSEIHAMGYHYNFGAYLSHNNIKHNFWEDATGLLSSPEILININRNGFPKIAEFCEAEHLYDGTANGIDKVYCNLRAQKKGFKLENAVDFDVVKEYMTLDESLRAEILAFFSDVTEISINENAVLILTQQFFSLLVMSFEEQALIYQLFSDYFFENEVLVFKTHPDDYMFYGILFPEAAVIKKKFPAEFLPTLFTNKPKKIATISSTAINNLKWYFDESFSLGPRFEREFRFTHRYKVAYEIKNSICPEHKLYSIGVNENYKDAFKVSDNPGADSVFYVIDKLSMQDKYKFGDIVSLLEASSEKDVFVFINSNSDYCFYDIENKSVWENLTPVTISKIRLRDEEFYENEEQETIYVYTKNARIADAVRNFKFSKQLSYTGLEISVSPLGDADIKIALLEALLFAAEKRLLAYETVLKNESGENGIKLPSIDESKVSKIRYSNKDIEIEEIDEKEKKMRILEGIIHSTEQRLIFSTL